MRYLHSNYVSRRATHGAHSLMAPLVLRRAERIAQSVPRLLRRRVAYYLTVIEGRVPLMALADALGAPRAYVRGAISVIEDQRDDPAFDALMDQLALELAA